MKSSTISKAVKFALVVGASSAALTAPAVWAEEEEVERIEVTGSRIKRTDLEGSTPVQVIDAQKMLDSGQLTVSDVLRNSPANAFGSFVETSGSGAQSNATISLRGLGSDRTLVLIDGRRAPGSPAMGAASANLNMIPMAMVERIEIMTDGGSAVYGSDAVAGVVNIITKKDYEGLSFNVGGGRPSEEGGDEEYWSVVGGISSEKGNITWGLEQQRRDAIFDKDRDYTKARWSDLNGDGLISIYDETEGVSYYGATIEDPDTFALSASPICDDLAANVDGFVGVLDQGGALGGVGGGTVCGYAYANISTNRPSIDRVSFITNANYAITDDLITKARVTVTRNKSFGRYAPPAAAWGQTDPADNSWIPGTGIPVGSVHNPTNGTADEKEVFGYFRWTQLGPRNNTFTDTNEDFLFSAEWAVNDAITVDAFVHWSNYKTFDVGNTYLDYAGLGQAITDGVDLGDDDAAFEYLAATTLTEASNDLYEIGGGISFNELFEMGGGYSAAYLGANYHEIEYRNVSDKNSANGWIGGSSGGDSFGERDVTSVFGELVMPVMDNLELNLALRWDDYSDVGNSTSPKVSVRYEPMDNLVLRASWGEGFRAPNMDELYGLPIWSAAFATDYVSCEANGTPAADCQARQFDTLIYSNEDLKAEESESINLGLSWDVNDWFGFTVDYYNIEVDNVITYVGPQSLIFEELATGETPDNLFRRSNGSISYVLANYDNLSQLSTDGIDLTLDFNFETEVGDFGISSITSYVLSYEEPAYIGGPEQDKVGFPGQPEYRSQLTATYGWEGLRVAYTMNYIDETSEGVESTPKGDGTLQGTGKLDSWTTHDIKLSYDMDNFGIIAVGARNFTNEEPVLTSSGKWADDTLHNNLGRVYFADYTISF